MPPSATQTDTVALWAVVPAAGSGQRMAGTDEQGAPLAKQYLLLQQQTVIEATLKRLLNLPTLKQLTVVLSPDDSYWRELQLEQHLAEAFTTPVVTAIGAEQRSQSVLNGLLSLSPQAADNDWVMVHDAARPCVRVEEIVELLSAIEGSEVGGLLASPVENTLKRAVCSDAGANRPESTETVDRSTLWYAYTPQIFRYGLLKKALLAAAEAGTAVTDEASAIEMLGYKPLLLESSRDNIKITQPSDLRLAENILLSQ